MTPERRRVVFSGKVQGVGFRMTAVHFARDLPLSGTVRNLEDGRVELVMEGPPKEIDALLQRLCEHFGAFIRTMNQHPAPPTGAMSPGLRVAH